MTAEEPNWKMPDEAIMELARLRAREIIQTHLASGKTVSPDFMIELMLGFTSEIMDWVGDNIGEMQMDRLNVDLINSLQNTIVVPDIKN